MVLETSVSCDGSPKWQQLQRLAGSSPLQCPGSPGRRRSMSLSHPVNGRPDEAPLKPGWRMSRLSQRQPISNSQTVGKALDLRLPAKKIAKQFIRQGSEDSQSGGFAHLNLHMIQHAEDEPGRGSTVRGSPFSNDDPGNNKIVRRRPPLLLSSRTASQEIVNHRLRDGEHGGNEKCGLKKRSLEPFLRQGRHWVCQRQIALLQYYRGGCHHERGRQHPGEVTGPVICVVVRLAADRCVRFRCVMGLPKW
ncbi:unnamed protein product [Protopolystoma xenopodis]|uniref:Uncharacterized protein n=1 Tax=Protopolystoma xenopodis TaxID=117903 RepID=A0A448XAP8_9PLAT|nr:unnamed protein product [Protopolystoma xenopodis]